MFPIKHFENIYKIFFPNIFKTFSKWLLQMFLKQMFLKKSPGQIKIDENTFFETDRRVFFTKKKER